MLLLVLAGGFPAAAAVGAEAPITFGGPRTIEDEAELWWARALADIDGDGRTDLVVNQDGGHGGWLAWYETNEDANGWTRHMIAREGPGGGTLAGGDLEVGDIDGDGDADALGMEHPGEWDEGGAPTTVYWFENPGWQAHRIGRMPAFVKDINIDDFNADGRPDVAAITNVGNTFAIFRQDGPDSWVKAHTATIENLHEGMDTGDIDGDGDADVAANGYWMESPGGDLSGRWPVRSIDQKWHNQSGGWQANATKVCCRDINGDGRAEVFIAHSESPGYPVSWYGAENPRDGGWMEHKLVDELPMAHTLQVADMDGDGDMDVLTGENAGQVQDAPRLMVLVNGGDNADWTSVVVDTRGTYNSLAADATGDGLPDIWRLTGHDAATYELLPNETGAP